MTGILRAIQNVQGVPRNTDDIGFMIPEESLGDWEAFLIRQGLAAFFRSDAFGQFQGSGKLPSIDLMVVTKETFGKLHSSSETKALDGIEVAVPAAHHLVALKLHAIQQPKHKLKEKDWGDVVALIQSCDLDLEGDDFKAPILKEGGPDGLKDGGPDGEREIRRRLYAGE